MAQMTTKRAGRARHHNAGRVRRRRQRPRPALHRLTRHEKARGSAEREGGGGKNHRLHEGAAGKDAPGGPHRAPGHDFRSSVGGPGAEETEEREHRHHADRERRAEQHVEQPANRRLLRRGRRMGTASPALRDDGRAYRRERQARVHRESGAHERGNRDRRGQPSRGHAHEQDGRPPIGAHRPGGRHPETAHLMRRRHGFTGRKVRS